MKVKRLSKTSVTVESDEPIFTKTDEKDIVVVTKKPIKSIQVWYK